ncbi:MAG: DUF3099 domain-containing protein [Sporichthyaceae bacterium]
MSRKPAVTVYEVSTARQSLTEDVGNRFRRYALTMGIRTLCFLGAIVTTGAVRWTLFAGALLLPYLAVVVANGGREPSRPGQLPVVLPSRTHLAALPAAVPDQV